MNVPTEYRVWLERDEWIATPVTADPYFLSAEGFGTTPEEALTQVGDRVSALILRRLDEMAQGLPLFRKNAEEAKR